MFRGPVTTIDVELTQGLLFRNKNRQMFNCFRSFVSIELHPQGSERYVTFKRMQLQNSPSTMDNAFL